MEGLARSASSPIRCSCIRYRPAPASSRICETNPNEESQWADRSATFGALNVDSDRALRDPDHPTRMLPRYDCGDHLHPSDLGYNTMGDAIDLSLFE